MEEKCLNKFLELFSRFNSAAFCVGNEITDSDNNPLTGIENLTNDLILCGRVIEAHEDRNMLYNALNEVKQNLWSLSTDNRILYLKSIIRKFIDISIYTNNNYILCVEDTETGTCSRKGSDHRYMYVLHTQDFLENEPQHDKQTIAQQYISLCAETLYRFECELGRICEVFDINFIGLQDNLEIYLRKRKEYGGNYSYGYFKLSYQSPSTETSPTLFIGGLTVEQTKNLFELVNGVVFRKTSIEIFVESLNNPEENTLIIEKQDRATVFFNYWDKIFNDDTAKKDLLVKKLGDNFLNHYSKRSNESRYTKLPLDKGKTLDKLRSDLSNILSPAKSANSPAK